MVKKFKKKKNQGCKPSQFCKPNYEEGRFVIDWHFTKTSYQAFLHFCGNQAQHYGLCCPNKTPQKDATMIARWMGKQGNISNMKQNGEIFISEAHAKALTQSVL